LALLAHEQGDEAAATQYLQAAAELGQHTTLVDWPHRWSLAQAKLRESAGQWDATLEWLDEAKRVFVKNPIPVLQPIEARKARVYLEQGRLHKAQAWVRERGLSTGDQAFYRAEYEHLTLVQVRLAEGSLAGVNELLERLLTLAETQKRIGSVIEILLIQALVYQAGVIGSTLASEQAGVGRTGRGICASLWTKRLHCYFRPMGEIQSAHSLRSYVDKIVRAFSQPAKVISQPAITDQASGIVEPLTGRELEIIRLIAAGKSNREISQQLYLALSTVKGHNLRIFDKLQSQNRTEAVARAREMGLL
jgi:LuxR family maltose regulon positive regulatory protein